MRVDVVLAGATQMALLDWRLIKVLWRMLGALGFVGVGPERPGFGLCAGRRQRIPFL